MSISVGMLNQPFKVEFQVIQGTGDNGYFALDNIKLTDCNPGKF